MNLIINSDAVPIDFWHRSSYRGLPGLWEQAHGLGRVCAGSTAPQNPATPHDNILAAMHNTDFGIYFFDQFQIALPPEWIAIILRASGIGPVGASQN